MLLVLVFCSVVGAVVVGVGAVGAAAAIFTLDL